jgi:lipopolysaccharide export system permease protein
MKKLIFRKISKDLVIFFSFSILLLGLIVWTLQAINYFDLVAEDGHGIKLYFFYSVLNFPKIIHKILPFVFFVSLFYILISYEAKNELNILWINGIHKIEFMNKIIFFSIILMFLQILNGSYFSPMSQLKARNLIKNSEIDFFTSLIKEGKFINVVQGLTIFINKKNKDGSYSDIYLDDSTVIEKTKMIYAKNGMLIDNKKQKIFKLFNGKVINNEDSKINVFEFDQINFNLKDYTSNSTTAAKIQEINTFDLLSCFSKDSKVQRELFRCDKKFFSDIKQELLKRLYKPIYIPLIAIVTCFMLISSKNKINYIKVRNLIFMFAILVIIFSETSLRYSISSNLSFFFYLLAPWLMMISTYSLFLKSVKNV